MNVCVRCGEDLLVTQDEFCSGLCESNAKDDARERESMDLDKYLEDHPTLFEDEVRP